MKRITTMLIFIFSILILKGQNVKWENTINWKIYNIQNSRAFFYSPDTLKNFGAAELKDDSIHYFLKGSSQIDSAHAPVWMGLYKATCIFPDNKLHRIDVSVYGGFFYDEEEKKYYQVSEEKKEEWLAYFLDEMKKF